MLLTTSVMVYIEGSSDIDNAQAMVRLDVLEGRLREAVAAAFAGDPAAEAIGTVAFRYPGEEGVNVHRCAVCGGWLTDDALPDPCEGLPFGHRIDGEYRCLQHFEIATGEVG